MGWLNSPVGNLTAKWWRFSKGNHPWVVIYIIMFTIANGISFFEPLVVGWLLNTIQEQGLADIGLLIFIAGLFMFLRVAFWLFHGPARIIENQTAFKVRANYKQYLIKGVLALPPSWHVHHHSGDTIDKIEKGTGALYQYSSITYEIIETVIRFTSSYLALAYFNLHASYIVLFIVLITILIVLRFDKHLLPQYRELNKNENAIARKIFDVVSNITTVIILRIEKLAAKDIWQKILYPYYLYKKTIRKNELKWFLVSMSASLMMFLVIGSYLLMSWKRGDVILIGTIYALYGYVERISGIFFRFTFRYGDIVRYHAAVQNSEEVATEFRKRPYIKQYPLRHWKTLHVKNLSFSYEGKDSELHLDNVSLNFRKGERIAFIGESGSGKTTMLKLIRGLYTSQTYTFFVDDQEIPLGFKSIKENIALIPQDPEIFNTTILENITMGLPHHRPTIRKYTDMARSTSVIERLPRKWDSLIGEKGVNLSGGEKQRLALARGLLACRDKPVLLLDEPTSSVDAQNELAIYKNIFGTFKNKTIISTVHRLHLLPMFDTIYMFKEGRIVASGSYDELSRTSKDFKTLLRKYAHVKEVT